VTSVTEGLCQSEKCDRRLDKILRTVPVLTYLRWERVHVPKHKDVVVGTHLPDLYG
jgi:hypothetical protein